ncbi:unnamed protein product [Ambrosiozyma monospora]|uniref:Unnamed protein product n=1 Tax=Ambrosiozyma monospora TaxID=43982 RepID=A0ACB5TA40_AMBMO|nr:unnamed protein product [Ambrosiozyma monospora]
MSAQEYYGSGNQTTYNGNQHNPQMQQQQQQGNGERGFIATVVGGYAGSKMGGHSKLGRIGGALAGAYGANKVEDMWHSHKKNKQNQQYYQQQQPMGGQYMYAPGPQGYVAPKPEKHGKHHKHHRELNGQY